MSDQFTVSGPPPDGFTILYNQAAETLIKMHSTPKNCYLALCLFTDGNGKTFVTREKLAKKMGDVSLDTVDRAIKALEEADLLEVQRHGPGRGLANTYQLKRPQVNLKKAANGPEKRPQTGTEKAAQAMRPQQYVQQEEKTTTTTGAEEVVVEDSISHDAPVKNLSMAQTNGAVPKPHTGNGVYKPFTTEADHPYWQGVGRKDWFEFLLKAWPKMTDPFPAMRAIRETLGETADDPVVRIRVEIGRQWWLKKWEKEGTPEKFITGMKYWFEQRRWESIDKTEEEIQKEIDRILALKPR